LIYEIINTPIAKRGSIKEWQIYKEFADSIKGWWKRQFNYSTTDPRYQAATELDIAEDYALFLAEIDNEDERSGKRKQQEWEEEMKDADKFREWQAKFTIKNSAKSESVSAPKTIELKNNPIPKVRDK